MKFKKLFKPILFCLLGILLFLMAQEVLTPDWSTTENVDRTVRGIAELEDDSLDVLFLGPSTTAWGASPMKLYEDTGICSYNLGTSSQSLVCSYYLLQYALEHQSPSLVVIETTRVFGGGENDYSWRFIIDNLQMGPVKENLAKEYEKFVAGGDMLNAIFPILKFHSRWNELSASDFKFTQYGSYYSGGQFVLSKVGNSTLTSDVVEAAVDHMISDDTAKVTTIANGQREYQEYANRLYYMPVVNEDYVRYLQKMIDLCESHGAQVLLVKFPSCGDPGVHLGTWTKYSSQVIRQLADEMKVPFLDLTYDVGLVVDYKNEMVDERHLNSRGAEKATQAIEAYLRSHYDIAKHTNANYDAQLLDYQRVRDVFYLQSEQDFNTYCRRLAEKSGQWSVFIAASDEYVTGLNDGDRASLGSLGLQLAGEGKYRDAYLAILDRGGVEYESLSNRRLAHSAQLGELNVSMVSSSWYTFPEASIKINYVEQAMNGRGLNFVVYDNESGLVIDSVRFDTFEESKPASRNYTTIYNMLRAYEAATCFD